MGILGDIKIENLGSIFSGIGTLVKDIRTAITGKEPMDATKVAELQAKLIEIEAATMQAQMTVVLAEASSQDKWTSRARPAFMYVIYILLLAALPFGVLQAFDEAIALRYVQGIHNWFNSIPSDLYALFGAGYLGYGAFRTYDKKIGVSK